MSFLALIWMKKKAMVVTIAALTFLCVATGVSAQAVAEAFFLAVKPKENRNLRGAKEFHWVTKDRALVQGKAAPTGGGTIMDAGFLELSTEASTPAATVCATCSLHSAAKLDGASEVQANTEQAAKKATAVSAAKSITPNAASGKQMSAASEESVEQEEGTDVQPVANVDDAEEALRLATEMLDLREKYDEIRKKSPQENGCTEEQAYQWLKGEREAMISEGECENALYQLWMFDRVLAPYGEHNHSEKSDHCEVAKKLYILARNRDLDLLRGSASDACKGRLAKWKGMMTVIHDPPSFFSVTHIQQNSPYAHGIQHLDNFLEKQEELRTLLAGSFAAAIPVLDDSVDLSLRPIEFLFIPKKKLADLIKKLKVLAQPGSP